MPGRDRDSDTQLVGRETSRHHAEVRLDGPLSLIRDLGSRNGVFVNGTQVLQSTLKHQDIVRLGEWVGVVVSFDPEIDSSFRSLAPAW